MAGLLQQPRHCARPNYHEAVIQFHDVHIGFAEGEILRGVSFSAQPRETLVLLGETGSGKTLTLKLAAGLMRPDSGTVDVLGERVSDNVRARIARSFAVRLALFFRKAPCLILLPWAKTSPIACMKIMWMKKTITPRVRQILDFVELGHTVGPIALGPFRWYASPCLHCPGARQSPAHRPLRFAHGRP